MSHQASGSAIPNCTALVNLCKMSVKSSLGCCIPSYMIQIFMLVIESDSNWSRLLYGIRTICIHYLYLHYLDHDKGPHEQFDLGRLENV